MRTFTLRPLVAAIAIVFVAAAATGEEFEGLEEAMGADEFARAGLDKLDAGELAALEAWIAARMGARPADVPTPPVPAAAPAAPAAAATSAARPAPAPAPAPSAEDEAIRDIGLIKKSKDLPRSFRSRIAGNFRGWTGETTFRLENGQVWQQRMEGRWTTDMQNPEVEIRRNLFGFYTMRMLETGRKIGVKRLE